VTDEARAAVPQYVTCHLSWQRTAAWCGRLSSFHQFSLLSYSYFHQRLFQRPADLEICLRQVLFFVFSRSYTWVV